MSVLIGSKRCCGSAQGKVFSGCNGRVPQVGFADSIVRPELCCRAFEHDMPIVMGISDTIIALADGEVVTTGTPAQVREHPEVLRAYLGAPV
jgi:ABC-type hemin transport system ATPase subunit